MERTRLLLIGVICVLPPQAQYKRNALRSGGKRTRVRSIDNAVPRAESEFDVLPLFCFAVEIARRAPFRRPFITLYNCLLNQLILSNLYQFSLPPTQIHTNNIFTCSFPICFGFVRSRVYNMCCTLFDRQFLVLFQFFNFLHIFIPFEYK